MIQIQVDSIQPQGAVLAGVLVPFENIQSREFDFLIGKSVINTEQNDLGYTEVEGNRPNVFLASTVFGKILPL